MVDEALTYAHYEAMGSAKKKREGSGPFRTYNVRPGDRYELSDGHAIYCGPTGGDGARGVGAGFQVLDSDPDVDSAGVDAGYALSEATMRAPDIAVGAVPDAPGWIKGQVPPLAVEYAGTGQDEDDLQEKIAELLERGTRWVWVVRLVGPRRVEVYTQDEAPRVAGPGAELMAPGVLRNPVPVEALFDRSAAHRSTLRNLLQRRGYESLEQVEQKGRDEGEKRGREEGEKRGRGEGLRQAYLAQITHRFGADAAVAAEPLLADLPEDALLQAGALILDQGQRDGLLTALRELG